MQVCALASAMLASNAHALPDLARGLAALERGEIASAEADLLPLAEQGYAQAQAALGRLYSRQDHPEAAAKAAHWLRVVAHKDPAMRVPLARALLRMAPTTADPGEIERLLGDAIAQGDLAAMAVQLRLYRAFPERENLPQATAWAHRVADSRVVEERAEAIAWYRTHASQADIAQRLLRVCESSRSQIELCYADLAGHYRAVNDVAAVDRLRKEVLERFERKALSADTLERVARTLSADDLPGDAVPAAAYALLERIESPTPEGLARKARLLLADPALAPKIDPLALLKSAYAQGSPEAALQLGRLALDPLSTTADPVAAERLLGEAALSLPAAHFYLGRMFERGYRGEVNPARAQRHYLLAARAGYVRADLALAQMYASNRGIEVDPVKAYAFARLAQHNGVAGGAEYLQQLGSTLAAAERAQGQKLAEREFAARNAAATRKTPGSAAAVSGGSTHTAQANPP